MYEVIGTRASRAFRVLWFMEEAGLDYTHTPATPRSKEAMAANPSGKVPALRDGETVIADSVAIITYLADRHGVLTHPAGTIERARQDALTFRVLDEIDATLWLAAQHSFILPEDQRVPQIKDALKSAFERNTQALAAELDGPFLAGESLTIPDILLVHCLRWAEIAKFPEPDERLSAYREQAQARPAFERVMALP